MRRNHQEALPELQKRVASRLAAVATFEGFQGLVLSDSLGSRGLRFQEDDLWLTLAWIRELAPAAWAHKRTCSSFTLSRDAKDVSTFTDPSLSSRA